ncbi:toll/interleukin-1 receptor-like protein [Coffea arabica]|uniref:Toll/interleukin-1 receptor-like protein n=1 Tax=Coffea arabica TaxID=13443 RepID=A0ABM4VZG6_COFAR
MDAVNDRESENALVVSSASNHHDNSWIDISSSSSSSSTPTWTYDVFLSFRGEDTRRTFVAHLFRTLCSKGIYTYKDDQRLEKGKSISLELLQAIQESLFSIVIFSKGYASSTWCLEELVKITECHETIGQSVLPIFYDIDPSDVRKQRNSFADAFAKHDRDHSPEKVQKWKEALSQAAGISGWHSCNFADETFELPPGEHDLVGVRSHMKEVISLMDLRSPEVRRVGIHGKAGIGKTTIILTLIVLDAVDHANQLEALAGKRNWFGTWDPR